MAPLSEPVIEIASESDACRVVLVPLPDSIDADALALRVEVETPDRSGTVPNAGVERGQFVAFEQALSALEANRTGSAVLRAIDEREFELSLTSPDSLGHIAVEVRIGSYRWPEGKHGGGGRKAVLDALNTGFQLVRAVRAAMVKPA